MDIAIYLHQRSIIEKAGPKDDSTEDILTFDENIKESEKQVFTFLVVESCNKH